MSEKIFEEKQRRARFTFFDALILLVILAAAFVGWYLLRGRNAGASAEELPPVTSITYRIDVKKVREEYKNAAQTGDSVKEGTSNASIGTIINVTVLPYYEEVADEEAGMYSLPAYPNMYTVRLTIRADATLSGNKLMVDGKQIAVGQQYSLQTAHFAGTGFCSTLEYNQEDK